MKERSLIPLKWHLKSHKKPGTNSDFILYFKFLCPGACSDYILFYKRPCPHQRGDKRINVLSQLAAGVILFDL